MSKSIKVSGAGSKEEDKKVQSGPKKSTGISKKRKKISRVNNLQAVAEKAEKRTRKRRKRADLPKSKEKPHKCDYCPKTFDFLSSLKRHDQSHKKYRQHICGSCGASIKFNKNSILNHTKECPGSIQQENQISKEIVEIKDERSDGEVGGSSVFEVVYVKSEKSERNDPLKLSKILLEETKESKKLYQCDYCPNKSFEFKSFLERHLNSHRKNFFCQVCNSGFKYKFALDHHMQAHRKTSENEASETAQMGDEIHKVPEGENPKTLQSKIDEKFSKRKVHNCTFCDYSTFRLHLLKDHILCRHQSDDKRKKLECEECHRKFKTKLSLTKHIGYVHRTERKFKCGECTSSFLHCHELKKHMKSHGKNLLVKCDKCPQIFENLGVWRNHSLKYHKLSKKCATKAMVRSESNIKLNATPNPNTQQCKICLKYFASAEDLNFHMENIHETLQCNACMEFFARDVYENHKMLDCQLELKTEIEVEEPTMKIL